MGSYVFVNEAVVPMRKEPSEAAEMVSQLLFGDFGKILEECEGWTKVARLMDDYIGWVSSNMLLVISEKKIALATAPRQYAQSHHNIIAELSGGTLRIPMGASFPGGENDLQIGDFQYSFKEESARLTTQEITSVALRFLGTPYLWGGRSSFGIDCSGLTQTVFAMCGKLIPRDSRPQAKAGSVSSWKSRKDGDLAFFSKPDKESISHVGIVHQHDSIIHASGRVRVDTLTEEGIILPSGVMSHRLIQINHYF